MHIILIPSQFLFALAPDGRYNRHQKHLLHLHLMTARKMITVKWMNPRQPTIAQWKQKFRDVYFMEALTAKLQLRSDVLGRLWLPTER